jgi:hypothetical protein
MPVFTHLPLHGGLHDVPLLRRDPVVSGKFSDGFQLIDVDFFVDRVQEDVLNEDVIHDLSGDFHNRKNVLAVLGDLSF